MLTLVQQQAGLIGSVPPSCVWEPFRDGVDKESFGAKSLKELVIKLLLSVIDHATASCHVTRCSLGKSIESLTPELYAIRSTEEHAIRSQNNFLWFFWRKRKPSKMKVTSTVIEVINDPTQRQIVCIVFNEKLFQSVARIAEQHNRVYSNSSFVYKNVVVVQGNNIFPHEGSRTLLINK